jgi:hypothetical protein
VCLLIFCHLQVMVVALEVETWLMIHSLLAVVMVEQR